MAGPFQVAPSKRHANNLAVKLPEHQPDHNLSLNFGSTDLDFSHVALSFLHGEGLSSYFFTYSHLFLSSTIALQDV